MKCKYIVLEWEPFSDYLHLPLKARKVNILKGKAIAFLWKCLLSKVVIIADLEQRQKSA